MIGFIFIGVVFAIALARAGTSDTGWHFAPFRAVGLIAVFSLRVALVVAAIAVAVVMGVIAGTVRSTFLAGPR